MSGTEIAQPKLPKLECFIRKAWLLRDASQSCED